MPQIYASLKYLLYRAVRQVQLPAKRPDQSRGGTQEMVSVLLVDIFRKIAGSGVAESVLDIC